MKHVLDYTREYIYTLKKLRQFLISKKINLRTSASLGKPQSRTTTQKMEELDDALENCLNLIESILDNITTF